MSNAAVLMKGAAVELADGLYLERADPHESKFEDFLRGVVSKFPKPNLQRRRLRQFVAAVNGHEAAITPLSDANLPRRFSEVCRQMRARGFDDAVVAHAFAIVREASRRILGMRHHDVQLIGGWALLQGR